jgi:cbb3-type cytochrome oxidase subunit 3
MRPFRVSILGLMGLILLCGVWFAWFRRPTFHAASFAFTTMLTILLLALIALRYSRSRDFWFGFVVLGWGYAILAFAPGCWMGVRPYLITSHPLGDLADLLGLTRTRPPNIFNIDGDYNPGRVPGDSGLNPWFRFDRGERFQRIGHSFAAILHGVIGGLIAVFLASRRHRQVTDPAPPLPLPDVIK